MDWMPPELVARVVIVEHIAMDIRQGPYQAVSRRVPEKKW
jgi:tRNA A22 N-methylase